MVNSVPSTNVLILERRAYKETGKEFQRGAGKPGEWEYWKENDSILGRKKSTLSNHAKKAHKIVLIIVIENTYRIYYELGTASSP